MSTKRIDFSFKIEGVLTDATSLKLSNTAGTFGARRQDTGEVIVADGTDFIRDDIGLYHFIFLDLVDSKIYEYWIERVYTGNTRHSERTFVAGATSEGSSGYYWSRTLLTQISGIGNLAAYSSLDGRNLTDIDEVAIQSAGDEVDASINDELYSVGVITPLTRSSRTFTRLELYATRMVLIALYSRRGNMDRDQNKERLGKMSAMRDEEMAWFQHKKVTNGFQGARFITTPVLDISKGRRIQ